MQNGVRHLSPLPGTALSSYAIPQLLNSYFPIFCFWTSPQALSPILHCIIHLPPTTPIYWGKHICAPLNCYHDIMKHLSPTEVLKKYLSDESMKMNEPNSMSLRPSGPWYSLPDTPRTSESEGHKAAGQAAARDPKAFPCPSIQKDNST